MSDFTDAVQEVLFGRADADRDIDAIGDEVVVPYLRDLLSDAYTDAAGRFLAIIDADVARHDDIQAAADSVHQDALRYVYAFAHGLVAQFKLMKPTPEDAIAAFKRLRDNKEK